MGFNDLTRNREAKARVLAEFVLGTVGIEALEYPLEGVGRDAGAVVLDRDVYLRACAPQAHAHLAVRGRERTRVIDQIVHDLSEPVIMTSYEQRVGAANMRFDVQSDIGLISMPPLVGHV